MNYLNFFNFFFKIKKKNLKKMKISLGSLGEVSEFRGGTPGSPPKFRHPPKRFGLRLAKSRQNGDVPKRFGWSFGVPGTPETPKRVPDPLGRVPV